MRVLVVDDHDFVRRGICSLLATDPSLIVCGQAEDGRDAVEKAKRLKPDIVVMDISMPVMNGLEATREIKQLIPKSEVIIVSQHETPEMYRQAFNAGATAYVVKTSMGSDLLEAITRVSNHEIFINGAPPLDPKRNLDAQEILQRSATFERSLRESEERFRSAMNSMVEGLYTLDKEGQVTYINPAAEGMFGWTFSELRGRRMHYVTHYRRPDGSPFPAADCPGLQVLKKGIELREHEDFFIRKDGSSFPVVFSASALKVNGEVVGVVVCFRDNTEHREALQALQLRAAIVDSSDDAIVSKTLDGTMTSWNKGAERMFGYSEKEAIGQNVRLIIPPDRLDEETTIIELLKRGDRVDHFETLRLRKDGSTIEVSLSISPVKDSSGKVIGASKVARNISERKQLEQAQRDKEKKVNDLG